MVRLDISMKIGSLIIGLVLFWTNLCEAKAVKDSVLLASTLKIFSYLDPYLKIYIEEEKGVDWPALKEYYDIPKGYLDRTFPLRQTLKNHYFLLTIFNDTPDISRFFVYCTPQEEIYMRTTVAGSNNRVSVEPVTVPGIGYDRRLYPVEMAHGDTLFVQIKMSLSRHPLNLPFFFLIPGDQAKEFVVYWRSCFAGENEINLWMVGMILMMGLYILVKYFQIRSKEYSFYALYILFMTLFIVLKISQNNYSVIYFEEELLYSFAYRATQASAYCMYFVFFQHFLTTDKSLPSLHRQINLAFWILCSYMLLDLLLTVGPDTWVLLQSALWNGMRIVLMVWTFYSVIYIYNYRNRLEIPRLSIYLIGGVVSLTTFALVSMVFSINQGVEIEFMPGPFRLPFTYFEIGIVIELLFFSAGLGYKNRMDEISKVKALNALKREAERLEFEHYRAGAEAQEAERNRIAKDLHDGVGGMLSGIRFSLLGIREKLSPNLKEMTMFDKSLNQLGESIHELRKVAHDLMPVSLVNKGLLPALREYCQSLNDLGVLRVVLQSVGQEKRMSLESEQALYRVIQELLTNAIRHSKASEVLVQTVFTDHNFCLTVEDNGLGFDKIGMSSDGTGLSNINSRVLKLNGKMDIESIPNEGTSVYIEIPVR